MVEYGLALGAALVLALLSERREIVWSAAIIIASWALWCLFILVTGDYEPWYWGILIDGLAIMALTWRGFNPPPGRFRAVIAALFTTQIVYHVAYGFVALQFGNADWEAYYMQTQVTGWAQLLIVGGWGGGVAWRRIVDRGRRRHLLGNRAHYRDIGAGV